MGCVLRLYSLGILGFQFLWKNRFMDGSLLWVGSNFIEKKQLLYILLPKGQLMGLAIATDTRFPPPVVQLLFII